MFLKIHVLKLLKSHVIAHPCTWGAPELTFRIDFSRYTASAMVECPYRFKAVVDPPSRLKMCDSNVKYSRLDFIGTRRDSCVADNVSHTVRQRGSCSCIFVSQTTCSYTLSSCCVPVQRILHCSSWLLFVWILLFHTCFLPASRAQSLTPNIKVDHINEPGSEYKNYDILFDALNVSVKFNHTGENQ